MIKPLLEIRSIPISFEYKNTDASLEYKLGEAELHIEREKKGLKIKTKQPEIKINSVNMRNSTEFKTVTKLISDFAQKGIQAAHEATARYAREGEMMTKLYLKTNAIAQICAQRVKNDVSFELGFTPSEPLDISIDPGGVMIEYEADKLKFNWRISNNKFEYTPWDLEFIIKQYPRLDIKYLGEPFKVPLSANSNKVNKSFYGMA